MFDRDELKSSLHRGVCKVTFTKANGETRVMHCTLNESILPPSVDETGSTASRKENLDIIAVWDVEKGDWRSFRLDSVTSFNTEFNL